MLQIRSIHCLLLTLPLFAGCEARIYESAPAKDGEIYVLNRFTGSLRLTDSDKRHLNLVTDRAPDNTPLRTCTSDFSLHAVKFDVSFRPIGDALYYRVGITPAVAEGRQINKERWQEHMDLIRFRSQAPRVNIRFLSSDNFVIVERDISLSETMGILDEGTRVSYEGQDRAEVSEAELNAISGCTAGFSGFPSVGDTLSEPISDVPVEQPVAPAETKG